jgi:hypothetical protein
MKIGLSNYFLAFIGALTVAVTTSNMTNKGKKKKKVRY